eukprot:PhM_4_TR15063/c0_g1_i1/m.491
MRLVTTFIIIFVFCFATSATSQQREGAIGNQNTVITGDFNPHQRCPACLLFSRVLLLTTNLPDFRPSSALSTKQRRKFLRRDDRVSDVMDTAVQVCLNDFAWVEGTSELGRRGRYWSHDDLRSSGLMTADMERTLTQQRRHGGDSGLKNYIYGSIIGENEELVEAVASSEENVLSLNPSKKEYYEPRGRSQVEG